MNCTPGWLNMGPELGEFQDTYTCSF
jgi:hypothetical protein